MVFIYIYNFIKNPTRHVEDVEHSDNSSISGHEDKHIHFTHLGGVSGIEEGERLKTSGFG